MPKPKKPKKAKFEMPEVMEGNILRWTDGKYYNCSIIKDDDLARLIKLAKRGAKK